VRVARCLARAADQCFEFRDPRCQLLDQILLLRQQRILLGVTQPEAGNKRHTTGESDRTSRRNPSQPTP
jgi:hypothetical protein